MRNIKALLFLFVLHLSFCHSQGKDGLVAAPYPGSIGETPAAPSDQRTFYTKDPLDKVMAHYTKTLGAFGDESQNIWFREAIPSNDVMDILAKRGIKLGESREFAGVRLHGKKINANYTVTTVIDRLKRAWLLRYQDEETIDPAIMAKHLEEPGLKKEIARYEPVLWKHFPMLREKHMDEVTYEKCIEGPEKEAVQEEQELVKKMSQLTKQMKYDEAGKVGDRMMQLSGRHSDAKRNWDMAIKCLQELETNAYSTMIIIDKHPSQWDLTAKKWSSLGN